MLELYIANKNYSSWSLRPWVLMRELGIPFVERLQPFEGARSPGFVRFSPSGKVPALHDGDIRVWDSLAIVEYLAESHRDVWPTDRAARAYARSASAEMHSGFTTLRSQCSMNVGVRIRTEMTPSLREDLDRLGALWSEGLSRWGGPFLTGAAFTAVDAFFAPVAFRIQTYGLPTSDTALAYASHLRGLPSMVQWERDALAETWREPGHEVLSGALLEDLRALPPKRGVV